MDKLEDLIIMQSSEEIRKILIGEADIKTSTGMIIAIKGDPYTGKTTCADAIAKSLKCSVLSFDDILYSLSPSSPSSPQEAHRLREVAFNVALRVAGLQLFLGPVVIDSPLSDPIHLHRLLQISDGMNSHVAIVECKPTVKYDWQMRFEKRDRRETDKYWFKPREWWSDVRESPSVESYAPGPGYNPDTVSRLIVDTTGYVDYPNLGAATIDLVDSTSSRRLLHFEDWLPPRSSEDECGSDGRHMLEETQDFGWLSWWSTALILEFRIIGMARHLMLLTAPASCGACGSTIDHGAAYYACKRCKKLALHKSCTELPIPDNTKIGAVESFPDELKQSCTSEAFWEMHLKSRLLPTVIHHEGVPGHSVCIFYTSFVNPREYQCAACKLPGTMFGYTSLKTTFRFNLHAKCALLPLQVSNLHGGYQHDMRLVFGTQEIKEDYLCDVCGEQRNPTAWYYYCHQCVFVSHLHCIYALDDESHIHPV